MLEVDLLAVGDFALVDAQREPAFRVGTNPRLEEDRSAFLAVIGQRNERSAVALQALRKVHRRLLRTPRTDIRAASHPTAVEPIGPIGENQDDFWHVPGSAPARNRTWTTGSGDLRDILFTTGAGRSDRNGPRITAPDNGSIPVAIPTTTDAADASWAAADMNLWTAAAAVVSAPAKLNLHLRVVGRRPDGYHLLDSIVAPISVFDSVTVRVTPASVTDVSLRCDPPGAAPETADNLAARAARAFLDRLGTNARVAIELVKRIPVGAGLGGGSSDAAAVLRGLNALLRKPVTAPVLRSWALELGADVPLFLV